MHSDQRNKKVKSYPGERRRRPRFPFLANFEALEPQFNIRIEGRVSDIGMGGCYVNTISPLPEGTLLRIRIRKENECFEAQAKVGHSDMHMGMGLIFVSAKQDQVTLFQKWLREVEGVGPSRPDSLASPA